MHNIDYISILAGGFCKFECSFCVGNEIRRNETPKFSKKIKSFIECFSDQTNLLSVSGDTSDPCFIEETYEIPKYAKKINKDLKITLHTRNKNIAEKAIKSGYDKYVLSINEKFLTNISDFNIEIFKKLSKEQKIRLSIVITNENIDFFYGRGNIIEEIIKLFEEIQITLRPNVFEDVSIIKKLKEYFGEWEQRENGVEVLKSNNKIWLWDYRKTNEKIKAVYLFSNGEISSNCKWKKIIK